MLASTSMVDPLLTSPMRTRRHDDDMAALQRMMPPLELPPSVAGRMGEPREQHREKQQKQQQQQQQQQQEEKVVDREPASVNSDEEEEEEEAEEDPFRQLMNRGNYLRQLRLLALADEQERQAAASAAASGANARGAAAAADREEKKDDFGDDDDDLDAAQELQDRITTLPNNEGKVLDYDSYLAHQRYHDDLKHVDVNYIDYGSVRDVGAGTDRGGRGLVVEQRKRLGKGGLCWDAAFVLGEHVVSREDEWNDVEANAPPARVAELGAGTGLCGLMIAKAARCRVEITDLPELLDLMESNVERNFGDRRGDENGAAANDDGSSSSRSPSISPGHGKEARGTVSARVLRWGAPEDYGDVPYDVVVGADIVTSLYDPRALAETIHALSGPSTKIYISGKARLDKPHEEFDAEMNRLFRKVVKIDRPVSRLRSPGVFVIVAEGKR